VDISKMKLVQIAPAVDAKTSTQKLYAVTTLRSLTAIDAKPRVPAICTNLRRAKRIVETNEWDIYEEGYYPYVVIETFNANILYSATVGPEYWYMWNKRHGRYEKIDKPRELKNVCAFGIG
jgi:hypothetical protein